jgi:hypothetical protein
MPGAWPYRRLNFARWRPIFLGTLVRHCAVRTEPPYKTDTLRLYRVDKALCCWVQVAALGREGVSYKYMNNEIVKTWTAHETAQKYCE